MCAEGVPQDIPFLSPSKAWEIIETYPWQLFENGQVFIQKAFAIFLAANICKPDEQLQIEKQTSIYTSVSNEHYFNRWVLNCSSCMYIGWQLGVDSKSLFCNPILSGHSSTPWTRL